MRAGPMELSNHSVSFVINCNDQAELDRNWDALLQSGGLRMAEGSIRAFLADRAQPTALAKMMADPDRAKSKRAADALMKI